ncbi:NUDIX hydrolase [Methylococcus geothermalis]|uniref:Phosphatase NudJ n=1 Tax=Methylococcus geothermalis TaxID=2681310 RepID=A0A858Q8J6_9GAMM|nr:NUDIX hydrolase [Methylococcus geothermalis]QJD30222.1 NUDIX domain-containing protein [Methylococcus geothermalis]
MQNLETPSDGRPRVTVAAVVERDGRFLCVEERTAGSADLVINQPAGHVEAAESVIEAAIRETLEETGWHLVPEAVTGIYLWRHPASGRSFLRIAITGRAEAPEGEVRLDEGIERAVWLSREELLRERERHRSPLVLHTVEDYLRGERHPLSLLKPMLG